MKRFASIINLRDLIAFWLHKILRSKNDKKFCCVSLSRRGYKVITLYQLFRRYKTEGRPIFFFPFTTSADDLSKALFECLEESCTILHEPTRSTADYLKLIKERSLKDYYTSSVECTIELNPITDLIKFTFWQQAENGCGMIPSSNNYTVKYQKGKEQYIAQRVIEALTKKLKQKETH